MSNVTLPDCSYDYYHEFEYEKEIGVCDYCHKKITSNQEAYLFEDEMIHGDCLYDYMDKFKV